MGFSRRGALYLAKFTRIAWIFADSGFLNKATQTIFVGCCTCPSKHEFLGLAEPCCLEHATWQVGRSNALVEVPL